MKQFIIHRKSEENGHHLPRCRPEMNRPRLRKQVISFVRFAEFLEMYFWIFRWMISLRLIMNRSNNASNFLLSLRIKHSILREPHSELRRQMLKKIRNLKRQPKEISKFDIIIEHHQLLGHMLIRSLIIWRHFYWPNGKQMEEDKQNVLTPISASPRIYVQRTYSIDQLMTEHDQMNEKKMH